MTIKKEIYEKTPIENWRIEIIEDSRDMVNLRGAAKRMGTRALEGLEDVIGKALINGELYLEAHRFKLLGDGSLVLGDVPGERLYVLQIDLTELTHIGFLARLDLEIGLRRRRGAGFERWLVHGHLKENDTYIDYLELDDAGNFYLHNRRMSWNTGKMLLANPLP